MKNPTKTQSISHLLGDHQEVRRVLSSYDRFLLGLEGVCDEPGAVRNSFQPQELWDLLDYLSEHLLMCHEEKEEIALLPALSRHGLSWEDTDLQHVRQEHRHIRYLMRSLRQSVHQLRVWSRDDCRHFLAISRELASFLEHHMRAEEKHLFARLDTSLTEEEDERLSGEFDAIQADFQGMPDAQRLQASGEEFVRRYAMSE